MVEQPRVEDFADRAVAAWSRERPDLDLTAMGPLARFVRLGLIGGRLVDATFTGAGLDRGEFDVLATLRRGGAPFQLTPSTLAAELLVSKGGITKRIDRLVDRGWVTRTDVPGDRRSVLIELTDEGRRTIDELVEQHVARESALLAALTPAELTAFDHTLRVLLRVAHTFESKPDVAFPVAGGVVRNHD